jgi:hypothetical protein
MAPVVYKSHYPSVTIPDTSITDFVFENNPVKGHDDVPSFIDGISDRTVTFSLQKAYMERFASALANPAALGYKWTWEKGTVGGFLRSGASPSLGH